MIQNAKQNYQIQTACIGNFYYNGKKRLSTRLDY